MAEPLVIELVDGHRIVGHPSVERITRFGDVEPVREFIHWHYDCTCGELAYATAAAAQEHLDGLRARSVPVP